jgi:hypothetical protein
MVLMIGVCLFAAHLTYFGVEIGSRRYLRKLLDARQKRVAANTAKPFSEISEVKEGIIKCGRKWDDAPPAAARYAWPTARASGPSNPNSIMSSLRVLAAAAVLGALVTIAAEHGTQAQETARVNWVFPTASALNSSKLAGSEESDHGHALGRSICEDGASKSARRSG